MPTDLKASTPAPGSSVAEVKEIRLGFNESVNPKFSGADLKDGAGKAIATGPATFDSTNKKELIVPVSVKLEPGNYTVEWHAVARSPSTLCQWRYETSGLQT